MKMTTIAFAVALLFSVTSAQASVMSDAQQLCNTASPQAAATYAMNSVLYPTAPGNNAKCPQLCKRWVGVCKANVASSLSCLRGGASRMAGLLKGDCATLSDPKSCKDFVTAELKSALSQFKAGAVLGRTQCETNGLAACLNIC